MATPADEGIRAARQEAQASKELEVYRAKPYGNRETWAIESLSKELETILEGFTEGEQAQIRVALGRYVHGYLGLRYGLCYG